MNLRDITLPLAPGLDESELRVLQPSGPVIVDLAATGFFEQLKQVNALVHDHRWCCKLNSFSRGLVIDE